MSHMNDNVFQNIDARIISPKFYDTNLKMHKKEFTLDKKIELAEEILDSEKN